MEPQQQTPPPQNSEYDFILNAAEPKKQIPLPIGNPNSTFQRALLVGGAAILFIILALIVMSFLKSDGGRRDSLLRVSQLQQEIIRVTEKNSANIASQNVKNVAVNTYVGIGSSQRQLNGTMALEKITFKEKELLIADSSAADTKLEAAKAAGTFDATFLEIMKQYINMYKSALTTSYDKVSRKALKDSINTQYQTADLLAKQLETVQP